MRCCDKIVVKIRNKKKREKFSRSENLDRSISATFSLSLKKIKYRAKQEVQYQEAHK